MNKLLLIVMVIPLLMISQIDKTVAAQKPEWGKNVGIIFGYAAAKDNIKGVKIHKIPRMSSKVLAYIKKGDQIWAHNTFENGWVKVKKPFGLGWLQLSRLKPVETEATISKVDIVEGCLPVRNGPASTFKKIGCTAIGQRISLSGIGTKSGWVFAEKPERGWVQLGSLTVHWPSKKLGIPKMDETKQATEVRKVKITGLKSTIEKSRRVFEEIPVDTKFRESFFNESIQQERGIHEHWADTGRFLQGF